MDKGQLGQYFTPQEIAKKMIGLIKNKGTVLEPSCGNGAFYNLLKDIHTTIGLEIDPAIKCAGAIEMDYFDWQEPVDTIIGNPPYVKYQHILPTTLEKLPQVMDKRSNLYLFFIWHSIDLLRPNGELIFIVPRDFIKTTGARELNKRLYNEGGFTFWEEYGDAKIFPDADPNVVIFRWQKGAAHTVPITFNNGFLSFVATQGVRLGDLFEVKVGAVSGDNDIYYCDNGNIEIATSTTKNTGKLSRAWYTDKPNPFLLKYKDRLMLRGIRKFNENNWWEWGRKITPLSVPAIFVNCKTRDLHPFYTIDTQWYDGSLLALIPKTNLYSIEELINILNSTDWQSQGFQVGGRLIFTQRSILEAVLILKK